MFQFVEGPLIAPNRVSVHFTRRPAWFISRVPRDLRERDSFGVVPVLGEYVWRGYHACGPNTSPPVTVWKQIGKRFVWRVERDRLGSMDFFKVGKESWIYESCENPQKTIHRSDWSFTRDKFSFLWETIEKFRKRSKRNHGKIDFLKIGKESRNKYISHVRIPLFFFVNVIAIKVQSFHVMRNWETNKIIHRSDRSSTFLQFPLETTRIVENWRIPESEEEERESSSLGIQI